MRESERLTAELERLIAEHEREALREIEGLKAEIARVTELERLEQERLMAELECVQATYEAASAAIYKEASAAETEALNARDEPGGKSETEHECVIKHTGLDTAYFAAHAAILEALSQIENRGVGVPASVAWPDFAAGNADELELFPGGKRKDMVDASGGAFNKLYQPTGFGSSDWVSVDASGDELEMPDRLEF